jgi:hypothetical protein
VNFGVTDSYLGNKSAFSILQILPTNRQNLIAEKTCDINISDSSRQGAAINPND